MVDRELPAEAEAEVPEKRTEASEKAGQEAVESFDDRKVIEARRAQGERFSMTHLAGNDGASQKFELIDSSKPTPKELPAEEPDLPAESPEPRKAPVAELPAEEPEPPKKPAAELPAEEPDLPAESPEPVRRQQEEPRVPDKPTRVDSVEEEEEEEEGDKNSEPVKPAKRPGAEAAKPEPDLPAEELTDSGLSAEQAAPIPGAEYTGEGIRAEVSPRLTTYSQEKSIEDLARAQLGPEASQEDILKYEREILKVNGAASVEHLEYGSKIKLPGHTKDGSLITDDPDGSTRTVSVSGAVKLERPDGTTYEARPVFGEHGDGVAHVNRGPQESDNFSRTRIPDGIGGYKEKGEGSRDGDRYELIKTFDGRYRIADNTNPDMTDKTEYDDAHPDLRVERAKLLDHADEKLTDPIDRGRFYNDANKFEVRVRRVGLSSEEEAKFDHQVDRLFVAKDNTDRNDLPDEDTRIRLAEQIMRHAADPTSIDQGFNPTCGPASLEVQMFSRDPADVARLIADMSITGQFVTTDGQTVTLDPSMFAPQTGALFYPLEDGTRTYASQLFQATAVTMVLGNYRKGAPTDASKYGEFVSKDGHEIPFDGVMPNDLLSMVRKIAGQRDDVTIIGDPLADPAWVERLDKSKEVETPERMYLKSEADLRERLHELKSAGRLPAIVFIHSAHEPFWADSGAGAAGGAGGGHYVTITDYDESTQSVSLDNQWGRRADHKSVSVQSLFLAGLPSGERSTINRLAKAVLENKGSDPTLELELLREAYLEAEQPIEPEKDGEEITDFDRELLSIKLKADRYFDDKRKVGDKVDEDMVRRTEATFNQMIARFSEDKRRRLKEYMQEQRKKETAAR